MVISRTQQNSNTTSIGSTFIFDPISVVIELKRDLSFLTEAALDFCGKQSDQEFAALNRRFCPPENPNAHPILKEILTELQQGVFTRTFVHENALNMVAGVVGTMTAQVLTRNLSFRPLAWGLKTIFSHFLASRLNAKLQHHHLELPQVTDIGGLVNVGSSEIMHALTRPLLTAQAGNPAAMLAVFLLSRVSATGVMTLASMLETKVGNVIGYSHEDISKHYNARALTHTFCMDLTTFAGHRLASRVGSIAFHSATTDFHRVLKAQAKRVQTFFSDPIRVQQVKRALPFIAGLTLSITPWLINHTSLSGFVSALGLSCFGMAIRPPKPRVRAGVPTGPSATDVSRPLILLSSKIYEHWKSKRPQFEYKGQTVQLENTAFETLPEELRAFFLSHAHQTNKYMGNAMNGLKQAYFTGKTDIRLPVHGVAMLHYFLDYPEKAAQRHFEQLAISEQNFYRMLAITCLRFGNEMSLIASRGPNQTIDPESPMEIGHQAIFDLLNRTALLFEAQEASAGNGPDLDRN